MKIENKILIRLLAHTGPLLGRSVWLILAVILLAAAGHLVGRRQTPPPPRQSTAPLPSPQTDWHGVDHAIVDALKTAHRAAQTTANSKLDAWTLALMRRVDADFLPWYFAYWNQQLLGLKSAWYWTAHQVGLSPTGANERITGEIRQQFAQRVMRPQICQLELERIAQETFQTYVDELNPKLAAIPNQYRIPQPEWDRYLDDIAFLTTRVDGNRGVPLTLKTVAATTAGGGILLVRAVGPEIRMIGTRLAGTLTGPAATTAVAKGGGKLAARIGGEAVGELIGIVIILWDVADHYRTKRTELPILRRNIADYLEQMRRGFLDDPDHGIMTMLDRIETTIVSSLRTREAAPR